MFTSLTLFYFNFLSISSLLSKLLPSSFIIFCFSSTPDEDHVSKALVFLIVLYVSSYRWVHFSRAVLFSWEYVLVKVSTVWKLQTTACNCSLWNMMMSGAVNTQGFVWKVFLNIFFMRYICRERVFVKGSTQQWLAIAVSSQEYVLVKGSTQTIACHFSNQLTVCSC